MVSNRILNSGNSLTIDGPITIDADLIAGGTLTLDGAITLDADSHVSSGGLVGDDLTIIGSITGQHNLTLDAGNANIALTGDVDVNSLSFANAAQLTYGGGTLHTTQAFDFGDIPNIFLNGDTTIHAGAGTTGRADITASANTTILAGAPNVNLTLFGDLVTLNQIGDNGSGRLQTLFIDANTVQLLGTIHTVGAQTINATQGLAGLLISNGGDITLNTTSTLLSDVMVESNGGNVFFNKPIDGAHNLTVDAGTGDVFINTALGGSVPLSSFDATGEHVVLNGNLSVTGGLTLNVPVILAGDSMLSSNGSALTINGVINGAHTLTLDAQGGDITLAQGGHVSNYVESSPAGHVLWGGPGLQVDNDVYAEQVKSLDGKLITATLARLNVNNGATLALNVGTLYYSGGSANFTGTIDGYAGEVAANRIGFGHLTGGPITFNGLYNLPMPQFYLRSLDATFVKGITPEDAASLYTVSLPPLSANNTVTVEE